MAGVAFNTQFLDPGSLYAGLINPSPYARRGDGELALRCCIAMLI